MTLPASSTRGGFRRKVQLGLFIRNYLASQDAVSHDIYTAYKGAVQSEPTSEDLKKARRKIRRAIIRQKRSRKGEHVIVTVAEIDANLDTYLARYRNRKRRCCSYNSFMHYIWVLRQLGLVEATGEAIAAQGKSGSQQTEWHESHRGIVIHALPSGLNDSAWSNLWQAYRDRG